MARGISPALQSAIRVLIVLFGLFLGFVVYSYGMFHKLTPNWSDIAVVENCGVSRSPGEQTGDRARLDGTSSLFCQVAPGKWIKTPYGTSPLLLAFGVVLIASLAAVYRTSALRRATRTARRVVALFLVLFGIPMMLLGLQFNFVEGTLTLSGVLRIIIYAALGGGIMGLLGWYMFVKPFRDNHHAT